ncbi:MAG: hypothetical protein H6709_08795 [Kofleriaceae bacterium]|nr:hypothetical protein [Kofleriaceae bacterium]MCB9572167.1 hypothetical protein [Kofleriaceae bacterium]
MQKLVLSSIVVALAGVTLSACTVGDPDPDGDAVAGAGLGDEPGDGVPGSIPLRVCADGATLTGVDVSFYQGAIDWARARDAGVAFAFIRVSDGLSYPDGRFASNWAAARAAGVTRGAYQFFRPGSDAVAQADLLIDAIGALAPGDLPPVIDVEATSGLSAATIVARIGQWVDRIEARLGVTPIVYTGKYFWQDSVGASAAFVDHPLWVAQYTSACPDLPTPWTRWTFWQSSDAGTIAGIPGGVDVDRFNGSRADLDRLTVGGALAPIEVYWARRGDGAYDLRALAPAAVTRVAYVVDGYPVGSATRADGSNFPASYQFSLEGDARQFEVRGYDGSGRQVGLGVGLMDVTAGTAVYIKQMGAALYEIGLERAPAGVAAVEVRADGYLLTDAVTGRPRSTRGAVRATFQQLGRRDFRITTFDADGSVRGHLYRTFTLR